MNFAAVSNLSSHYLPSYKVEINSWASQYFSCTQRKFTSKFASCTLRPHHPLLFHLSSSQNMHILYNLNIKTTILNKILRDFPDISGRFCKKKNIDTNLSLCQIMLTILLKFSTWPQMTSSQSDTQYKYL